MGFDFVKNIEICSSIVNELMAGNVGLLYYSHIPAMAISFLMGFFVFFKSKKNIVARIFFLFSLTFFFWALFNFIAWVSSDSRWIMFSWSLLGILSVLFYILSLYFVYVFIDKRDISFAKKMLISLLFLPIIIFTPTVFNLKSFDFDNCYAIDNLFFGYVYVPQAIAVVWILWAAIKRYIGSDKDARKQILLLMSGISFFLLTFFGGAYIADNYELYRFEIYGLFAMVVFMGFLAYLIVKFKAFNIKLVGAQALVIATIILIGSQFAFIQNQTNKILTAITLVLVVFFGWLLVASVKKEVRQREELEKITAELKTANLRLKELDQQKTDFLSIASHQLRTPISVAKGYIELIQDGAYGKINKELFRILNQMNESNEHLVKLVDEFLDITRIEQGRTKFDFTEVDPAKLIGGVVAELSNRAKGQGLKLSWKKPDNFGMVSMDSEKVRHVVFNFIDNAIKYSEKGNITVSLKKENNGVAVRVQDQGFGFGEIDEANFFQKFYRGDNVKTSNVTGTGLGLYVCRKFIEAHSGHVWAHSAGLGKGSEFGFWIPFKGNGEQGTGNGGS